MMNNPNYYFVFDLETLGLNQRIHQVIEIGGVLVEGDTLELVMDPFRQLVKPQFPVAVDDRALKVNNLTLDEIYKHGLTQLDALMMLTEWLKSYSYNTMLIEPVCNNKTFDIPRLEQMYLDNGLNLPWHYAHKWDVKDMARDFSLPLEKISLETLCNYFNVPYVNGHSAVNDAVMTAYDFIKLEKIRRAVGSVLHEAPIFIEFINNLKQ